MATSGSVRGVNDTEKNDTSLQLTLDVEPKLVQYGPASLTLTQYFIGDGLMGIYGDSS